VRLNDFHRNANAVGPEVDLEQERDGEREKGAVEIRGVVHSRFL
jgi:hypothetical protein